MTHIVSDRIRETSTTTGTGTYSLAGAVSGYQAFDDDMATNDTCWYVAHMGANWEVGLGTFTSAATDTIARTTILASSNGDAAVDWGAGTKHIFMTVPASKWGRVGDGTVGAPSIGPFNDPDSGMYVIGANNLGIAVAGAKVLDIATTGLSVTGVLGVTGTLTISAGNLSVTGTGVITSASAAAFAVGRLGATTPALNIDASTGTSITGMEVKSAAASGGVDLRAIGETNVTVRFDAKGSGTIRLGATSTGAIEFSRNAVPTANDGAALGTTSLGWADLHLATGGVINWANGEVTITETSASLLTIAGGVVAISDTTEATSFSAASVTLAGGLGVAKDIIAGGNITVPGFDSAKELRLRVGFANNTSGGLGVSPYDHSGGGAADGLACYGHDGFSVWTAQTQRLIVGADGSIYTLNATGGAKGIDTINAKAVYDDNVLLTDYVFDKFLKIDNLSTYSDRVRERFGALDTEMFSVHAYVDYWRKNQRLYGMPDLSDCIDGIVKEVSLGGMCQLLTQTAELQAIHIGAINDRVNDNERRIQKLEEAA